MYVPRLKSYFDIRVGVYSDFVKPCGVLKACQIIVAFKERPNNKTVCRSAVLFLVDFTHYIHLIFIAIK